MQKLERISDRFIFGVLAALLFYMVIFIYLNDISIKTGATRFIKGSHKLKINNADTIIFNENNN